MVLKIKSLGPTALNNAVIAKMVNENTYKLIQIMFQVIQKVAPEKTEDIKRTFYEELQSSKQLQDVI